MCMSIILIQDGCTALMWASRKDYIEIVELLLQYHANINTQCNVRQNNIYIYNKYYIYMYILNAIYIYYNC